MSRGISFQAFGTTTKHLAHVKRFYLVFGLFAFVMLAVVLRLLYLQMLDAENLKHKAHQLRNPSLVLFNRGRILDRRGRILAQDTLLYDLFAHPRYYWKVKPSQIASSLSPVLDMPYTRLSHKLAEPESTIGVAKNLPKQQVDRIRALRIGVPKINPKTKQFVLTEQGQIALEQMKVPGLDFVQKTVRNYPQGTLAAHILGYVNDEAQVSSGVERTGSFLLKKTPENLSAFQFNGKGDLIGLENLDPEHIVHIPKAEDLVLTVDSRLQYIAERELIAGIERSHAKKGTVIMMNPKTGEILAFAVTPTYQPDQFYKAPGEFLKNWAITDVYPPGSTFKILTIACGLETGAITPNTKLMDTGRMTIGGWPIQNYDYGKHGAPGMIDLVYLFQHSSNIGSAKVSMMIPVEKHHQLLRGFGMGSRTRIDLPGESRGILRPPSDWDLTTHATIGFGYGLASTPIQMAAAISAIANHGIWTTPHVIQGQKNVTQRRVLSEKTATTLTNILVQSIETAKNSTVKLDGFHLAGKTGTSRKPRENGRGYDSALYTSFVGYFPANDPRLLVMVVVDSPTMAEAWGSTVAGPIFKAIAEESINYLGMRPNGRKTEVKKITSISSNRSPDQQQTH